jgi:hypothetical protein
MTMLADTDLINQLFNNLPERYYSEQTKHTFQNQELAALAQANYTAAQLAQLEQWLDEKGTLALPIIDSYSVMIDGTRQPVSIVAATEINEHTPNHGDMSSMLYLRDHIQAASVLMELYLSDQHAYQKEGAQGRTLLLSALHLMSTPAQLDRFDSLIARGTATQEDWPHISLLFDDLEGKRPNGWRNKQDTFQMLAYLVCDALERKYISISDLGPSHKKFLGSVAPVLHAVGFPIYENSGSWEEIAANRTSVMSVETALLGKIETLVTASNDYAFLLGGLGRDDISLLLAKGLEELGRRLPLESPDYPKGSIKYREADAALAYVLLYGLPELLAARQIPIGPKQEPMTERAIETMLLDELATLIDPETGGMRRYDGDSYQRVNFHTSEVRDIIATIKRTVQQEAGSGEIDLDKKQTLRGELTPKGKEAAWTHPLGQLASWAAKRSLRAQTSEQKKAYQKLATRFLNQTLATVTGEHSYHAVLDSNKQYIIQSAPAARLPECYVAYQTTDGQVFTVPSPHTPLNWSSAMLKEAVGLVRISMLQ